MSSAMNCFEARKEFRSFWRRVLAPDERAAFTAHLSGCAKCDRSFRVFALSAPVLHSDREPEAARQPLPFARPQLLRPASASRAASARRGWRQSWTVAAAAALLLAGSGMTAWSVAPTSNQNVMEAIAGDDPGVEPVSYITDGSFLGQDEFGSDPSLQEPLAPDSTESRSNGLAG